MDRAPPPLPAAARADLVRLLRFRAENQPDDTALGWLGEDDQVAQRVTYAAWDRQARALAAHLQERRLQGERALLLFPPSPEYLPAFFGCLYAGVVPVPAYPPRPHKPAPRVDAIVADARATVALTTSAILAKVQPLLAASPGLRALTWLTPDTLEDASDRWVMPAIDAHTVAYLQYTSGTTALPRGVRLTHGNLVHNSALIAEGFGHTPRDSGLFWLPVYHDMGLIGGVLQPMWIGRPTTLMAPAAFLQSPFRWLHAIATLRATISGGPDMAYDLCARQVTAEQRDGLDLSSWDLAFTGAEPVRAETLDRFCRVFGPHGFRREAFYPCYGIAEATLIVTGGDRREAPPVLWVDRRALGEGRAVAVGEGHADGWQLVSSGRSLGGQDLRIVSPADGTACQPGCVGEIWLRGPCVGDGYFGSCGPGEGAFGGRLEGDGGPPFLRTGDLGFLRDGELFVVGRLADLVVVEGRSHYPHDVERTAEEAHAALRPGMGAALGTPAGLVLVFEVDRHAKVTAEEIAGAVAPAITRRHGLALAALVLLRTLGLPRTTSGKVQRVACRDAYLRGSLPVVGRWDAAP
jgi:acyl-CoA synthetase (AMP-forming)/AMP-acid ligase II